MIVPPCVSCGGTVIELDGQFEKLNPMYAVAPVPDDSAGWWHASCLAASAIGADWYQARLRSYRDVRGYGITAELAAWTVVGHPRTREVIGLGHDGRTLALDELARAKRKPVDGGGVYAVDSAEFNLELARTAEHEALIAAVQQALTTTGSYRVLDLYAALGLADRVQDPIALDRAVFRFERGLRGYFTRHAISARVEYGVFVAAELEPHVVAARR
jgi:hypothetical protein